MWISVEVFVDPDYLMCYALAFNDLHFCVFVVLGPLVAFQVTRVSIHPSVN